MSENRKIENTAPEMTDEELDAVTGGRGDRSKQIQTVKCATEGCTNQISADSPTVFCKTCLGKMRIQGSRPI